MALNNKTFVLAKFYTLEIKRFFQISNSGATFSSMKRRVINSLGRIIRPELKVDKRDLHGKRDKFSRSET